MRLQRSKNITLLAAMAKNGITGIELAARSGISRGSVSLILNQRVCPKPQTAQAIARALGTTSENLGFPSNSDGRSS